MDRPDQVAEDPPVIAGAIEYPANPDPGQPIPARNLQDLLYYSTEASGGVSQTAGPLDEQSRRFLDAALASMTTDVIAHLRSGIETVESLLGAHEFNDDDTEAAFDDLLECVEKIDFANDFHRIGGFRIFTPCLTSSSASMRWRCCELIAELCQNNPYCQSKCLEEGHLLRLLQLINDDASEVVKVKALYAVSCLVRDSAEGLAAFAKNDGFSTLLRALQTDCEKLKIKSSFLLTALCSQSPEIKDDLVSMGYVEQLVGLIIQNKSEYNVVEHLLSALLTLVTDNGEAEEISRKPQLQLRSILEHIEENAKELDEAREVVEYAQAIKRTVFSQKEASNDEDR